MEPSASPSTSGQPSAQPSVSAAPSVLPSVSSEPSLQPNEALAVERFAEQLAHAQLYPHDGIVGGRARVHPAVI